MLIFTWKYIRMIIAISLGNVKIRNNFNVPQSENTQIMIHSEVKASACSAGDPGLIPGWEDNLEKEMATHSSILAWRIPWREEPGRLQSMGSQRVRHE